MKIAVETIGFDERTGKAAFSLKEAVDEECFEINGNSAYVCYALVEIGSTFDEPIILISLILIFVASCAVADDPESSPTVISLYNQDSNSSCSVNVPRPGDNLFLDAGTPTGELLIRDDAKVGDEEDITISFRCSKDVQLRTRVVNFKMADIRSKTTEIIIRILKGEVILSGRAGQ